MNCGLDAGVSHGLKLEARGAGEGGFQGEGGALQASIWFLHSF